ncbi:hypothetical protein DL764_005504 [Monosporascus ibericus]|uniref:SAC domain-containing protein n=1 Tax=Monosporascus ibericus TaxID=155417 RepID=A0A4Q4TC93_9PEZI|nr:hypothetical protein DL764_005504 [Monosporascus ibericus]
MPSLARKLLICAAVDGLILQPLATKSQQRPSQPVKIRYGDGTVSSISRDQVPDVSGSNSSFEAFGIIGFFTVSRLSYLVSITGREQVAQVRGFPVYVITDVALTPCTSQAEAERAISHTAVQLRRAAAAAGNKTASPAESHTESETESEIELPPAGTSHDADDPGALSDRDAPEDAKGADERRSSIVQDVIKNRGSYGRFAQKWFSNKGWRMDQKRHLLLSGTDEQESQPANDSGREGADNDKDLSNKVVNENVGAPPAPSTGETLLPKLLRMAHIWFGTSRSFFFSYDVDLTRSLAARTAVSEDSPLHKTVDPTFFWNRVLLKPFADLQDESFLLPVMQGFVGQRSFIVDRNPPQADSQQDSMEMNDMKLALGSDAGTLKEQSPTKLRPSETEFLITVISRRSTKRAGLRYLRRGVDDEGYAANFVETEQLLSTPTWDPASKVFSFVQVRGSIPLFFTQSPYSLKPLPVLQHSPEANFRAFKNHIHRMGKTYGSIHLVNLVERHGVEAIIGKEYEKNVEKFNQEVEDGSQPLAFEWFDFHSECRGMKFENVSLLLDTLGKKIEETGSTVEKDGQMIRKQNGVLRTNCMDCLDRTNVCQSSFAKFMLDLQLKEEGFDMAAQADQQNTWFNTLWADNGDAISKQYASTAAMKGDYTRTRRRDYRGLVNDLGLSLSRFYNSMVNDYFSQAAIDFFLGNVTSMVFDEFEATMMTKDPAVSVQRMREQAIETSQKIAIEDPEREDFIGGWTMLSPHAPNTVRSLPFEEVILLLTDAALYLCRFDWKLDKVKSFERVDLAHVVGLRVGTYVTGTISPADVDETKNVGLLVTYEPGKRDVVRTNTRSLSSSVAEGGPSSSSDKQEQEQQPPKEGGDDDSKEEKEGMADGSAPSIRKPQGILSAITGGSSGNGGSSSQKQQSRKIIALKVPYARTSLSDARGVERITEAEQADVIAGEIERLVLRSQPLHRLSNKSGGGEAEGGKETEQEQERRTIIERGDIISLAEAKRSTGLLEQLGHSIKKLVWA